MERALREVHGSMLVAIPRPLVKKRGWRAGDVLEFSEEPRGVLLRRPSGPPDHAGYTIGYENRRLDELLALIKERRLARLIDVRERPISRKPGYSKNKLRATLGTAGIAYVHLPELGSPSAARSEYRGSGDFDRFRSRYTRHLGDQPQALEILRALLSTKPSAIMCFESDWRVCHRGILCGALEREGFKFTHL